jgi:hypothetical protein
MRPVVWSALAMVLCAAHVSAQTADPLAVGSRVRVLVSERPAGSTSPGTSQQLVGSVQQRDSSSVTLGLAGGDGNQTYTVPIEAIRRVEVSAGQMDRGEATRRGVVHGALGGAVVGGGLTAATAVIKWKSAADCEGSANAVACALRPTAGNLVRNTLVGGAVGAVVGVVLGSRNRERWEEARFPAVAAGTSHGGTSVALSFSF